MSASATRERTSLVGIWLHLEVAGAPATGFACTGSQQKGGFPGWILLVVIASNTILNLPRSDSDKKEESPQTRGSMFLIKTVGGRRLHFNAPALEETLGHT